MNIGIINLHNMCENNTLFLTRARKYFAENGHSVVDVAATPDLIFIGGCAVTDAMRTRCDESIRKLFQQHSTAIFVIFGCLSAFPEGLGSFVNSHVSGCHFIPSHASHILDDLIRARIPFDDVNISQLQGHVPYQPRMGSDDSYVLIAQGCINDCSYCNIRKAKGHVRSRDPLEIEREVLDLYKQGIRTVTLLADDCGSYGHDLGSNLASLLEQLCAAAPEMRYKLYTIFPSLFLQQYERMAPMFAQQRISYICLPAQSASSRILGLMNRNYAPSQFAEAIAQLRNMAPDIYVYSHFIFNFPTETWDEFLESIEFARHFDHCVFIGYGANRSTQAASIVPGSDPLILNDKVRYLEELVAQGQLSAFVVPCP